MYQRFRKLLHYRFNPHTHEGCDHSCLLFWYWQLVSIHTPTKGVTDQAAVNSAKDEFQSTHPRRVWRTEGSWSILAINVSIHTPTKGVTLYYQDPTQTAEFQSTHPRRVWRWYRRCSSHPYSFNPHTHEGCDLWCLLWVILVFCFNPHTHEGCD